MSNGRMCLRLAIAAGATVWLATTEPTSAMQFSRGEIGDGEVLIAGRGPILRGDFDRLGQFIANMPQTDRIVGIAFDSPGGSVIEAEKIATLVHAYSLIVLVGRGNEYSSACFLPFAAAAKRFVASDALVGIHSASDDGQETVGSLATTTAMARDAADYDVPADILGKMVRTPPNRAYWLTPHDLASMNVVILEDQVRQRSPVGSNPSATAIQIKLRLRLLGSRLSRKPFPFSRVSLIVEPGRTGSAVSRDHIGMARYIGLRSAACRSQARATRPTARI